MAKPKTTKTVKEKISVFPVAQALLEHHEHNLLGQKKHWQKTKNFPPGLLLSGPRGIGKREMAYELAAWLYCERAGFQAPTHEPLLNPCMECVACQKAVSGNWVDFLEITPETEEETSLKVEQFRTLKASQGFGGFDSRHKVILICDADRMTVQAANSMLKLLEEPPPGWIFLLTAADPALLLPTIVSRVQVVRLRPLSDVTLTAFLKEKKVPENRIQTAVKLAQGSFARALALAEDTAWEKRQTLLAVLSGPEAFGNNLNALVDWAALENKSFALLLDQLEHLTHDLIKYSLDPEPGDPSQRGPDHEVLKAYAQKKSRDLGSWDLARSYWTERADRLFKARQEYLLPMNKKLLAQEVLLPWLL